MTESENVCRACLESVGPYYYVLFENVSAYMFWFCTQIQIAEHESLPKALCTKCYELLSKFAAFKQKCIDSQNSLLNVKNVKTEADCTGTPKDTINEQTNLEEHIIFKKENQFDEKLKNDTFKYEYENFASDDDDDEQLDVNICKQQNNDRLKIPEKIYTYHCELCDKRFIRNKRYENHKRTHESEGLSCMSCDKTFKTKRGLREHQKNVHSPWSFNETKCRLCGKVFKSRNSLKQHEIRHGERKLYICDVCGKKCLSKSYLKEFMHLQIHLETHNEKKERNYGCDICNKKFFSKMYLNTHIHRAHTGRQYTCQLCNITYKYKDNLVKHLLTHEGKKLFKCDYCNKSFSTRKYCVEHQRAHSGERPFSCLYCPKKFMNKRHLSDHHKIHTGERKHKCAVCEQSFTQRGTMMRHMKIHNKAPLAC